MRVIEGNPIEIVADEGMVLTDGETYARNVCLGMFDSVDRWIEVDESEAMNDIGFFGINPQVQLDT